MISDQSFEIQSTEIIDTTRSKKEETCPVRPRIMTHSSKPIQRIRTIGTSATRWRPGTVCRATISASHPRSSSNRCGLFNGAKPDIKPILPVPIDLDLDDEALLLFDSIKPKMEPQLSVLSTDSGILPREIRDSTFVDDVIGELTSHGICHSDIISGGETSENAVPLMCCGQKRKRKASSPMPPPLAVSPNSIDDIDHPSDYLAASGTCSQFACLTSGNDEVKRIKNNAASRKSRANRKWKNSLKEQEIASLEEDNLRLSVLLKDFTEVTATCKRWLVQKMENPTEA